jgi:2-methylcitrate dehydratase PrpD
MKVANQQSPRTDLEAKFSIAFCAAIALLRGDAGEAEFDAAAVADPDVARLTARVTPEPDPSMPIVAAHMTVRLRDGRVLEHHVTARAGHAREPAVARRRRGKVPARRAGSAAGRRVSRLLTTLRGLVDLRDVSEIATLAAG